MWVVHKHGYHYSGNAFVDNAVCILFEAAGLTGVGMIASKLGLVVITLERYFKIVHAIAHRMYYRNWITSLGLALPWISGTCLVIFPTIATSKVVNGRCWPLALWPNEAMAFVSIHASFYALY